MVAWTRLRISNGAVEGMNNKIKLVSRKAYGFRTPYNYIVAIFHGCANLPMLE
ncbi:MAG: transposase [bacterium]